MAIALGIYPWARDVEAHQQQLKRGLAKMPDNFTACLCFWCEGTGANKEYNVLTKDFQRTWYSCKECSGLGLEWAPRKPAGLSVLNQVLVAGYTK